MKQDYSDDKELQPGSDEGAHALLAGYALGIATADEAREVEALLEAEPALRSELADYRRVTQAVLVGTPPQAPPPGALDAILKAVAEPVLPAAEPPSRWRGLWEPFLAPRLRFSPAAALLAFVLVVYIIMGYRSEIAWLRDAHRDLLVQQDQQEVALALMRAQDVRWIRMNDPEDSEDTPAFAWLIYSPGEQSGVILTNSFPQQSPDMAYQLWAARGDERLSLGVFQVEPDGSGSVIFRLPDGIEAFERMGITPEPAGGSPGPTAPPVVRLDLQQFH